MPYFNPPPSKTGGRLDDLSIHTAFLLRYFKIWRPTHSLVDELPHSHSRRNAASDIYFVSEGVFLALPRDGYGRDDSDTSSNGTLNSTTTPANYVSFVSYINQTQLSPFGLHNGEITMTSSYPRFSNNHNRFRRSFQPNTDQFKMRIVSTCPL